MTESSDCDGSDPTTRANLFCLIHMDVLTAEPYSLTTVGTLVEATVQTENEIGYSDPSPLNTSGATIRTIPDAPTQGPQRDDDDTTDSQIKVNFANVLTSPENGGQEIESLNLWWD